MTGFTAFALIVTVQAQPSAVDIDFVQKAAEDNIAELQVVNMVIKKTDDRQVKEACAIMIADHSKMLAQTRELARKIHVDLPTEPTAKHKALFKHFQGMTVPELNKKFTAAQLEDHIKDVNDANDETEIGFNADVKNFAKAGLMVFAKHEVTWRKVAEHLGVPATFGRIRSEEILRGKKIG